MKTRRERIAEMISETDMSPSEIARAMGMTVRDVLEDLVHISRSRKYGTLLVMPARCLKCGYTFSPDVKIPKKCPRCKGTWIEEPRFKIEKG